MSPRKNAKTNKNEEAKPAAKKPAPVKATPPRNVAQPTSVSPGILNYSSPGLSAATSALTIRPPVPEGGLAAFGIQAATPGQVTRDSWLKACLVKGPGSCGIVFRVEPKDASINGGSWAEKCFFDALRQKQDWIVRLNFHPRCLSWYHGDVEQKNSKGYAIRLFVIYATEAPSKDNVLKLGAFICSQVNAMPDNATTISVADEMAFFWIPRAAVWADVIGTAAAFKTLVDTHGVPYQGYYEKHRDVIHSYFRPGTLTHEIATKLRAPIEQVAPEFRGALAQQNGDDDAMDEFLLEDSEDDEE